MFTKHPEVFSNYLILSPAFWWGNGTILEYEELTRQANSNRKNIIYTGCGELEEGIRILAKEWNYRIKTYYTNCISDFHVVATAGHLSSAKENINTSIDFYFKNK
jgi:predicted alpha/beta superfamily hydrolase